MTRARRKKYKDALKALADYKYGYYVPTLDAMQKVELTETMERALRKALYTPRKED